MGAHFIARTHPYCDRPALQQWVREQAEDGAFKHGHEDGGYWQTKNRGVVIVETTVYDDQAKAEEFIMNSYPEKSDPLVAVPVMGIAILPFDIKLKDKVRVELEEAYRQAQIELNQFHPALVARAKLGKSALKGCMHCSSKVSVQHLKDTNCPVCGGNLLVTDTDGKKQASLEKKKQSAMQKVFDREAALLKDWIKANPDRAPRKQWLVAGLCRS